MTPVFWYYVSIQGPHIINTCIDLAVIAFPVHLDLSQSRLTISTSLQLSGVFEQMLRKTQNCLQCWKWIPYNGREVVFTAKKERNSPVSADQGLSTTSQNSCHVHGTCDYACAPPPYPTLFASTKPTFKMGLRKVITCSQSCTMSTLCMWKLYTRHHLLTQKVNLNDLAHTGKLAC